MTDRDHVCMHLYIVFQEMSIYFYLYIVLGEKSSTESQEKDFRLPDFLMPK